MFTKLVSSVAALICVAACSSIGVNEASQDNTSIAYLAGKAGIYKLELDAVSGELASSGLIAELEKPRFLDIHPTKDVLYVGRMEGEHKTGAAGKVTAYSMDRVSGQITKLNEVGSGGRNAAHIEISNSGKMAVASNFHGSSIASFLVGDDGKLSEFVDRKVYTGANGPHPLQKEPRPHSAHFSADDKFVYVPDLGTEKIYIYATDLSTGALTPAAQSSVNLPSVSGPRHFDFHPTEPFAYVGNEFSADVTVFERNEETGRLSKLQVISTLPDDYDGRKWVSEIRAHPNGKILYVANRAHDSIAVFTINPGTGLLTLVELEPTRGETPRHFTIDPSGKWLVVGNQYSDTVTSFSIDASTGELEHTGSVVDLPAPAAIVFFE